MIQNEDHRQKKSLRKIYYCFYYYFLNLLYIDAESMIENFIKCRNHRFEYLSV